MKTKSLLVFDTDESKYAKQFDEKTYEKSRMADTKFDDDEDNK